MIKVYVFYHESSMIKVNNKEEVTFCLDNTRTFPQVNELKFGIMVFQITCFQFI
ncbi:hypothetical protein CDIMF43_180012 [Carnobacterium divergens]|nr:hypothetical protein CDIMF43_180012 [Carnobacterium divergens]